MAYHPKASADKWYLVYLVDETDGKTPETGKTYEDITVGYCVGGATEWSAYSPGAADWKEAGYGLYWLKIGASEFTLDGVTYAIRVSCTGCDPYPLDVEIGPKVDAQWIDGSTPRLENLRDLARYFMANGVELDTVVHDMSVLGWLIAKADVSSFDRSTSCFEALREKLDALNDLSTGDITDAIEALESFLKLVAYCHGKTSRNETTGAVTFYKEDGETEAFTITPALTGRTVS